MAGDTRLSIKLLRLLAVFFLLEFNEKAQGYYCRSDWCSYNEYCCGFNECCSYLTGYWYLWIAGGVMIFSFFLVCFWMRNKRLATDHKTINQPHGYVLYGTTEYGDPIYVHQQPTNQYGSSSTQPHYFASANKGNVPLIEESRQRQPSPVQPPPYDYIERRTPSAPPFPH